jgi:hypothetical protein
MKLFVDTSGWMALYNPRDQFHVRARQAVSELAGRAVQLITTDYVLDETLTGLQTRYSGEAARQFGAWALQERNLKIDYIAEEVWQGAWEVFEKFDDQNFSFTDCTSFVRMRQLKLYEAFTFDQHFKQMGFKLWPR